jgi:hypothetical protein
MVASKIVPAVRVVDAYHTPSTPEFSPVAKFNTPEPTLIFELVSVTVRVTPPPVATGDVEVVPFTLPAATVSV